MWSFQKILHSTLSDSKMIKRFNRKLKTLSGNIHSIIYFVVLKKWKNSIPLKFPAGLPDFPWSKHTKMEKYDQMTTNYTRLPYIMPDGHKIFQMIIKCNNIFHSKALQKLPKLGLLVWKQTIWQPWFPAKFMISFLYGGTILITSLNIEPGKGF
jgi:hypothetical protein